MRVALTIRSLTEALRRAYRGLRRDAVEPYVSSTQVVSVLLGVTLGTMKLLVLALLFLSRWPYHCLFGISPRGCTRACVPFSGSFPQNTLRQSCKRFGGLPLAYVRFGGNMRFVASEALREAFKSLRTEADSDLSAPVPEVGMAQGCWMLVLWHRGGSHFGLTRHHILL